MTDLEIDILFDQIDNLMRAGDFNVIDKMFVWRDDVDWVLTMLTTTLPAKSKFFNRKDFYIKAEKQYGTKTTLGLG